MDEDLALKANAAVTITGTNGLTGGGSLAANRTIEPTYGVAANTVTQGNDVRLSNARTPTAHAASHLAAGTDPLTGLSITQVASLQAALDALTPKTRTLTPSAPLTGGGAFSADLAIGITANQASTGVAEGRAPWFANAPRPVSGRYVYTGYGANATTSPTLSQERCVPFPVWQGFTATSLYIEVTTLDATSVYRLGRRLADANGLPGALANDYGTVSGAVNGAFGVTPGGGIVFADRTLYYLSCTMQVGGAGALRASNYHDPLVLPSTLTVLNTVISAYVQAGVTGALPAGFTLGDASLGPRFMLLIA